MNCVENSKYIETENRLEVIKGWGEEKNRVIA